jgi:DNA-binding transcriptional LysR family regulator
MSGAKVATSPSLLFARLLARSRLKHLQLLVRIGELESLQKAADDIGMSQPGATHALAELETILGVNLFERHSRGMRPSPIGQALIPMVRSALSQLQVCAQTVVAMDTGAAGIVRVAAIGAALSGLLVRALPPFSQANPDVVVEVHAVGIDDLFVLLEQGRVDLLACREPSQLPRDFEFVPLLQDRYVVVGRASHPLVGRGAVSIEELGAQTWLVPPPTGIASRDFERLCQAFGISPRACWVSGRSVLLTLAMLQQRELLAFIPRNTVLQLLDAGLLAEVVPPPTARLGMPPVGVVVLRDRSRLSDVVLRFMAELQRWADLPAAALPPS